MQDELLAALTRLEVGQAIVVERLTSLEMGLTSLGMRLGKLEARMDSLETRMDSLETHMDSLETRMDSLETRMDSLGTRMDSFEVRLDRLETGQKTLRVDLMGRMDRLEDKLNAVRDDIGVNMGAATMARRVNDNTREEVRELTATVDALYRKVHRLEAIVDERRT